MIGQFRRLPKSLYFLYAGTMVTRMGSFVFPYLTIYLSEERGYGFETVGIVLSVGSVGLMVGNFAGGVLTDKWSRKMTLALALMLNAAGFSGLALRYESPWLYVLFLFVGYLGSGMFTPAANTVIADLAPPAERAFAYTINYVCINLGMGLGPLVGGLLATISYKWIFIGDVASSVICAMLILYGVVELKGSVADLPQTDESKPHMTRSVLLRHRTVLAFCLSYFFLIGPLMGMEYAVPLLVKKEFASSLVFIGVVYSINALFILLFSFAIENLLRNRNEYLMMVVAGFLWTSGMLVVLVGFSVPALLVGTAIWTIGEIIASILVPSFVAARVPAEYKGRFMALHDAVRSAAGVLCPIGLGFLWTVQSAKAVVFVIAMMPTVAIVCYALLYFVSIIRDRSAVRQSVLEMQP